jgi:hypothetical protein
MKFAKKIPLFLLITFFLYNCNNSSQPIAPSGSNIEIKGFSYTSFTADGFRHGNDINAIEDLKSQTANEWLSLCLWEYQSSPDSYDIAPNTTGKNPISGADWALSSTIDDLIAGIERAKADGLKIMLKPHLDLYSGQWRAAIKPDADGKWFRAYTDFLLKYAKIAEQYKIELFCIGVEYVVATQSQYTPEWKQIINEIRSVYSGELTYAASWGGATEFGVNESEFSTVGFWQDLDYIGIDFYYPLSNNDDVPSFDDAMFKMVVPKASISNISDKYGKKIIFTEIGIQSVKGAIKEPWNYSLGDSPNAVPDIAVQELYYQVILNSFANEKWCSGFFWWNWESVITSAEITNYTPRNKPAAILLKQWYQKQISGFIVLK